MHVDSHVSTLPFSPSSYALIERLFTASNNSSAAFSEPCVRRADGSAADTNVLETKGRWYDDRVRTPARPHGESLGVISNALAQVTMD